MNRRERRAQRAAERQGRPPAPPIAPLKYTGLDLTKALIERWEQNPGAYPCPWCSRLNDRASSVADREPRAGDIGICASCAGTYTFAESGPPVKTTEAELASLPPARRAAIDEAVALLRAAWMSKSKKLRVEA